MRFHRRPLSWIAGLLWALPAGAGAITAVPLPDPQVPGFHFPESEATVVTWVRELGANSPDSAAAFKSINLHGWGLWTALTLQTAQIDNGERLRVFETWFTPQEVDALPKAAGAASRNATPRLRSPLRNFVQFEHGLEPRDRELMAQAAGSETVFGYVKFDPTAADHVIDRKSVV